MAVYVLYFLSVMITAVSGATTCLQHQLRSTEAPSNSTISYALHKILSEKYNGPCSGVFPILPDGRESNTGEWHNGSLVFEIVRQDPSSYLAYNCQQQFTSIIYDCVEHNNYWGGNANSTGVKYAIYNNAFPKNWTPDTADVPSHKPSRPLRSIARATTSHMVPPVKQHSSSEPFPKSSTRASKDAFPGIGHTSRRGLLSSSTHLPLHSQDSKHSPVPSDHHGYSYHAGSSVHPAGSSPTQPRHESSKGKITRASRPVKSTHIHKPSQHGNSNDRSTKASRPVKSTHVSSKPAHKSSPPNDSYLTKGVPNQANPAVQSQLSAIESDALARQSYYESLYHTTITTSAGPLIRPPIITSITAPLPPVPTGPMFGDTLHPTPQDSILAMSSSDAAFLSSADAKASSYAAAHPTNTNCKDGTWDLTPDNYNKFQSDYNLRTFWFGGRDTDTVTWPDISKKNVSLSQTLAMDLEPAGSSLVCTIGTACVAAPFCTSYTVELSAGIQSAPSHWAWFVTNSIMNLHNFIVDNFLAAFTFGGIETSFESLDLTKTFTPPDQNQNILLRDLLEGFSFLAVATFILIPTGVIANLGVVAGVAAGDAGSFYANSLSSGNLDTKASEFGAFMSEAFQGMVTTTDQFLTNVVNGADLGGVVGGMPTLAMILSGGAWVSPNTGSSVSISDMQTLLRNNLVQRGINSLWSQTKTWVTFADLNDDAQQTKCKADKLGWQASKTCADGGVYYLYRFNEDGDHGGSLTYPWGADQMTQSPWNLDPSWVTASSAKSYRSQNSGTGGFAYDYSKPPMDLGAVFASIPAQGISQLNGLEGTWNISVCDLGPYPEMNYDFTHGSLGAFPCCCGPQCSQTADFVHSAQMDGFDTLYQYCQNTAGCCELWPDGITEIDYGSSGTITKPSNGCTTCQPIGTWGG